MTKIEFEKLQSYGFSPLPGRCVILLDPPPATIGHIVIPDSAKVHVVQASGYTGVVVAVEEGWTYVKRSVERFGHKIWISDLISGEDAVHAFKVGDRVVLGLHMNDLTEEVVWARNGQVEAVITTDLCKADMDGECDWERCPQFRDGEPGKSGRHCPIDNWPEED